MFVTRTFGLALAVLAVLGACAAPPVEVGPVRFKPAPFAPVSQFQPGASPAVAVLDVNGDELPDIYVGRAGASDVLLVQDVAVGWRIQALDGSEQIPLAALAVDLNGDFRLDLVVARASGLFVFLNQQGGTLQPGYRVVETSAESSGGALLSAGDINADGWTDVVYVQQAGTATGEAARVSVLVNKGKSHRGRVGFGDLDGSPRTVCCGLGAVLVADVNDDRWPDLVFAGGAGPIQLVENRAGETWVAHALDVSPNWEGISAADFDADGDLDLLVTRNGGAPAVGLLRNDGAFEFTDVTITTAVSAPPEIFAATWADVDADGLLDVVLSSTQWLRQVETGRFTRLRFGFADGVKAPNGHSVVLDFDRDGFADQLVAGADGSLALFHNEFTQNHWVAVRLRGHENRSTLGARVKLKTRDGKTLTRHQWINSSAPSNQADELLFGIGRRTELSTVEIDWAGGGYTRVDGPMIDRRIGFIEPPNPGARQVVLRHPLLESVKHRTSQPNLVCR